MSERCPVCSSPDPKLHPAVQHEGEVSICGDRFHSIIPPRSHPTRTPALAAEINRTLGQADALKYIDGWITSHLASDNLTPDYIAGLEAIKINVQSALGRIGRGEPMEATSELCSVSQSAGGFELTEDEMKLCAELPDALVAIADFHDSNASIAAAMGYRESTDHHSAKAEELKAEAKRIEATW